MSTRRTVIDRICEPASPLSTLGAPLKCPGEWTLASRHTIYLLRDGKCVAARARTGGPCANGDAVVGMRLVGWLSRDGAELEHVFSPGCAAVLRHWEAGEGTAVTFALTSACRSLVPGRAPTIRPSVARLEANRDLTRTSEIVREAHPAAP